MSWKIVKTATKWINKNLDFSSLLKSRSVLYFFVFLSIVNLYTLATSGAGLYAAIFILISFLTTFFSKNMIVVLCIGLVVTNILKQGIEIRVIHDGTSMKEGMSTEEGMAAEEGMKEGIADLAESDDPILKPDKDSKKTKGSDKKVSFKEEDPKPADEDAIMEKKQEYEKLIDLQKQLLKGMTTMAPLLKEAKESVNRIKQGQ
jgi:hypothetical protein